MCRIEREALLFFVLGTSNSALAANPSSLVPGESPTANGFIANRGQFPSHYRFAVRTHDLLAHVSDNGIHCFVAADRVPLDLPEEFDDSWPRSAPSFDEVSLCFGGEMPASVARGEGLRPGVVNFLVGSDPTKWATNVPTFDAVRMPGVRPGVDVVLRQSGTGIEYDLEIGIGTDVSDLLVRVTGARELRRLEENELSITTARGAVLRQHSPRTFAIDAMGNRRAVDCELRIVDRDTFAFVLPSCVAGERVTIDPVVDKPEYFTYLGGSDAEFAFDVAVFNGKATVTGTTLSYWPAGGSSGTVGFPLTPTTGQVPPPPAPLQNNNIGDYDIFVSQFDSTGSTLLWSTYLGGSQMQSAIDLDAGRGIDVDASGSVYVAGFTSNQAFPTAGVPGFLTTAQGQNDAFLFKLTNSGSVLSYFTFLAGSFLDVAEDVRVDGAGNAYVVGWTDSTVSGAFVQYPTTPGSAMPTITTGGIAGFLTKVAPGGTSLVYSTFIFAPNTTPLTLEGIRPLAVAIDPEDVDPSRIRAWVAGYAAEDIAPKVNAFQPAFAGIKDAFVTQLNPSGSAYTFGSYLGGADVERIDGIDISPTHVASVCGATGSTDFPIKNYLSQTINGTVIWSGNGLTGTRDAFVARIDPSQPVAADRLVMASYYGGSGFDEANSVAVDASGAMYVVGYSTGFIQFPQTYTPSYYLPGSPAAIGPREAFVMKAVGSNLVLSSFLGGNQEDSAMGIVLDSSGMYICGLTTSTDFAQNLGLINGYSSTLTANGVAPTLVGNGGPPWNVDNESKLNSIQPPTGPANLVGADAFVMRLAFRAN